MTPLLLLTALACTGSSGDTDSSDEVPTLRFLAPSADAVVGTTDVSVSLVAEHVLVAAHTPGARPPLLWLADAALAQAQAHEDGSTPEGAIALTLDGEEVGLLHTTTTTLASVAVGAHTLTAELVDSDGGSWDPPVVTTVDFSAE